MGLLKLGKNKKIVFYPYVEKKSQEALFFL